MTDQKKQFPEITKALGVQDTALMLIYQDGVPKTAPIVAATTGFAELADLVADLALDYTTITEGDYVWVGYERYIVVAADDPTPDATNGKGVKFNKAGGGLSANDLIDDDTMATATDTTVSTSESIKAYVDSTVSGSGFGNIIGIESVAAMQAATVGATQVRYYLDGLTGTGTLGGGEFWVDHSDTTTADDGVDVIVSADGKRFKRVERGIYTEYTDATAGLEDGAIVFHTLRAGAKTEVARFQQTSGDSMRYLFFADIPAWETSNSATYPADASPLNDFHFSADTGFGGGRVDAEFEAVGEGLRLAIEAPIAEDLFLSFEHEDAGVPVGFMAGDTANVLRFKDGPWVSGSDMMAMTPGDFRVNIGGGSAQAISTAETLTVNGIAAFQRASGNPVIVNRTGSDGSLVSFAHDGTSEGLISVSGTTVSYGSFSGFHWSQIEGADTPDIPVGTVVETVDELCEWPLEVWTEEVTDEPVLRRVKSKKSVQKPRITVVDGVANVEMETVEEDVLSTVRRDVPLFKDGKPVYEMEKGKDGKLAHKLVGGKKVQKMYREPVYDAPVTRTEELREPYDPAVGLQHGGRIEYESNEQLAKFKVSDTPASKAVYGVFRRWDDDGDAEIASLGTNVIRIGAGEVVQRGDLLESAGDGTARVQADDVIRSSTIGKVTAAITRETYADGSYTVPCALYCG